MIIYNPKNDPGLEEYRYIRLLLWEKGIEFQSVNDALIMVFRNEITQLVSENGNVIQYVLHQGMSDEIVLNTVDEYKEYLKTNPPLRNRIQS